jgi:negative regulator of flagellin synthesis FlgM
MKISDLNSKNNLMPYVNETNGSNQPEKASSSRETKDNSPTGDRVDLSAQSKEMQKIYDVLRMTPDVRAEKVAQYKKSIEDGTYRVAPDDVADKMLKDSLLELL